MKHKYGLAFLLTWMPMMLSQRLPPIPCPHIFGYYRDQQQRVYGSVKLPYDKNPWIEFSVNASFVGKFNQPELRLEQVTKQRELNDGTSTLIYNIFFPFTDVIPKITELRYNDRIYCTGRPEESKEVTNVWSQTHFMFSQEEYEFYKPETQTDTSDTDIPFKSPDETPTVPQQYPAYTPAKVKPTTSNIPQRLPESSTQDINIPDKQINDLKCGMAASNEVGATGTNIEKYPWLVALFWTTGLMQYEFKCSATLISDIFVLTAAECLVVDKSYLRRAEEILLVMGTNNLDHWNSNGAVTRRARQVDIPLTFDKVWRDGGNIAIILMDRPVQFSNVLSPVCLWKDNTDVYSLVTKTAIITGFAQESLTHILRGKRANMTIINRSDEDHSWIDSDFSGFLSCTREFTETLCAKREKKLGGGYCIRENGAGFSIFMDGAYYLIGIGVTLHRIDDTDICDFSKRAYLFWDVAKSLDWIKSQMTLED
ncbi:serine protease gd-like [Diabrotica undecimpunctata]|uniref:serine protease gd-like n=1 Tax=Diabrotica undecimpunctata TaxID=50387 RepID=UPI003B638A6E